MATGLVPLGGSITALLGPTNTGKTHRAVERMLEHATGMIGLPLRLLAREIYDRVTARVGERAVALVTGEEKRVPRRPRYWVCTTEAMPVDHEVEFLALDEIQLAAHRQRGHVFTDRLLHARGLHETWLCGADTMRPLVEQLVPTALLRSLPRLSTLRAVASHRLSALPARSAVIAFSVPEVYRIADRVRRKRGGAAVVLGALSPRTRNAQVAMFQAGEVDCLVATDAIGMGLNLDIGHVAFAELRKFDGREPRALSAAEIGQIAGRAGRHLADGTFGALSPLTIDPRLALDIECHRFRPVRRLVWRSHDLDFSSVDALSATLHHRPQRGCFQRVEHADDSEALLLLARREDVRRASQGDERVRLLWEVCQIPDFRKLLPEHHAQLLGEIFLQLAGGRGRLDPDWLDERVRRLEVTGGSIDELLMRMEAIRTWSYVAHRDHWIDDAPHWQERTQAAEDALSEALHQRLVERFVERRARGAPSGGRRSSRHARRQAAAAADEATGANPFSKLLSLRARAALRPTDLTAPSDDQAWIAALVDASHDRFHVDRAGVIYEAKRAEGRDGAPLARLVRGSDLLHPEVRLVVAAEPGAGARARLQRRLVAFARDLVADVVGPLRELPRPELSSAARGLVYQIERGLGTVVLAEAHDQVAALTELDRSALLQAGVVIGRWTVFLSQALEPNAIRVRMALCAARRGRPMWADRGAPRASFACERGVPDRLYAAMGYPAIGGRAVRADVVERVIDQLAQAAAHGCFELPRGMARRLRVGPRQLAAMLRAWGFEREGALWRSTADPHTESAAPHEPGSRRSGSDPWVDSTQPGRGSPCTRRRADPPPQGRERSATRADPRD